LDSTEVGGKKWGGKETDTNAFVDLLVGGSVAGGRGVGGAEEDSSASFSGLEWPDVNVVEVLCRVWCVIQACPVRDSGMPPMSRSHVSYVKESCFI